MKRAKIITLSIFLVLVNYAYSMNLIKRYALSKTIKQTKTYKTPTIKSIKPKKVFFPKKIDKKFYTTQNSPDQSSFWQDTKKWLGEKWYGKTIYQQKTEQNLYNQHLKLLKSRIKFLIKHGFCDKNNEEKFIDLDKKLFNSMNKTIKGGGIALIAGIRAKQLVKRMFDAKINNLDQKINATRLYEIGAINVGWVDSLLIIPILNQSMDYRI